MNDGVALLPPASPSATQAGWRGRLGEEQRVLMCAEAGVANDCFPNK